MKELITAIITLTVGGGLLIFISKLFFKKGNSKSKKALSSIFKTLAAYDEAKDKAKEELDAKLQENKKKSNKDIANDVTNKLRKRRNNLR